MGVEAVPLRSLGLRDADDREIFHRAREVKATLMIKDGDFSDLVKRLGPPPQILWLRCGNTGEAGLKAILDLSLPTALALLSDGEPVIEIR